MSQHPMSNNAFTAKLKGLFLKKLAEFFFMLVSYNKIPSFQTIIYFLKAKHPLFINNYEKAMLKVL